MPKLLKREAIEAAFKEAKKAGKSIGLLGAAGVIGAGALAKPEEAEAVSPKEYLSALKKIYPNASRRELAKLGQAIRRSPKIAMERIKSIEAMAPEEAEGAGAWLRGRLDIGGFKTLPSEMYLNPKFKPGTTPLHESGHELFRQMTPEDREAVYKILEKVGLIERGIMQTLVNTRLGNPEEFFAEAFARMATKSELQNIFPKDLRNIIKKYAPKLGVVGAAGAIGAGALAKPEEAEAAPPFAKFRWTTLPKEEIKKAKGLLIKEGGSFIGGPVDKARMKELSKNKLLAPLSGPPKGPDLNAIPIAAALAGAGALASQPKEAEAAPLSPEIKAAYKAAQKKVAPGLPKRLYRYVYKPSSAMEEGFREELVGRQMSRFGGELEPYKPQGLFFSTNPKDLAWFQGHGLEPGTKGMRELKRMSEKALLYGAEEKPDILRGVLNLDPKRVLTIDEQTLYENFEEFAKKKGYQVLTEDLDWGRDVERAARDWTKHFSEKYDAVHITGVHGEPGKDEWVILNKGKVNLFWKNKKLLASLGIVAGGAGATLASQPEEAEAGTKAKSLYHVTKDLTKFLKEPNLAAYGGVYRPSGIVFAHSKKDLVRGIMEVQEQPGIRFTVRDVLQAKKEPGKTAGIVKGRLSEGPVLETTDRDLMNRFDAFIKQKGLSIASPEERASAQKLWTEELKKNYSAVTIRNAMTIRGSENTDLTIVLDPSKVKLKKTKYILGAAGAGLAVNEAQAQEPTTQPTDWRQTLTQAGVRLPTDWSSELRSAGVTKQTDWNAAVRNALANPLPEAPPTNLPAEGEERTEPWYVEMGKETAKFVGSGLVAGAGASALSAAGIAVPPLAVPIAAGALYYGLTRLQRAAEGKEQFGEPTFVETIPGLATLGATKLGLMEKPITTEVPKAVRPILELAEDIAFFGGASGAVAGGLGTAGRVVTGGLETKGGVSKTVLKGIDWIAHKPLAPVTRAMEPAGKWVWENITVKPESLTSKIPLVGPMAAAATKFGREHLQRAIERMAEEMPRTAATFRKTAAMKDLVTEAGRWLGFEMQTLTPTESYQVMKGLRGTPYEKLKSPRARQVLSNFEARLKEAALTPRYEVKLREQISKLLTSPVEEAETKIGVRGINKLLKTVESNLPKDAKVKEIHKALAEVIEDPASSKDMVHFATSLYDLPANTPIAVADAARKAAHYNLIEKLKATKGLVSHIPKPGYVESVESGTKGWYLPKDVELELKALREIPQIARGWYQKWFMTPWKASKIILRPATHVRNTLSNLILNDIGGLPFYRADVYMDGLKGMRAGSSEWKDFVRMTGAGGTWSQQELYQLESGLRYGATMWDKLYNVFNKVAEPGRGLYQAEENMFKFSKYLYNIREQGMSKAEAALDAMKWTFNYAETTPFIAKTGKYAIPFVRWWSKALPMIAEAAVKHPVRVAKWIALGRELQLQAIQAVGLTDGEWDAIHDKLPEYIQNGLFLLMPWRDQKGRLNLLNLTYIVPGIGDIAEIYQRSLPELALQNPIVTIGATLLSKVKYGGAPLYFDWEDPGTKWAKAAAYIWEQLSPAIVPGGTDWNNLWDAIVEKEGAPTPEEALAGWFGFKLTPVDEAANARRQEAVRRIHESEIQTQMQRELRSAKTGEQAQKIMKKYQRAREGLLKP